MPNPVASRARDGFHHTSLRHGRDESIMQAKTPIVLLAIVIVAGCSSLPTREFRSDYQRASRQSVKIDGYPPFGIAELRDQKRLKVELNVLAQVFGSVTNPLVLMGVSDGIPSASAHRSAAQAYLVETGRPSCAITDAAVSPDGREFEFRYSCPGDG